MNKKIITSIILAIIILLGISTTSIAKQATPETSKSGNWVSYKITSDVDDFENIGLNNEVVLSINEIGAGSSAMVGSTKDNRNKYTNTNPYVYCIQHGYKMNSTGSQYTVSSIINIEGNTLTYSHLNNGTTETTTTVDKRSAMLVYAINAINKGYKDNKLQVQNALWTLINAHGLSDVFIHNDIKDIFSNCTNGYDGNTCYEENGEWYAFVNVYNESVSYGNSYTEAITENYAQNNIIEYNGDTIVGPFNWTFPHQLSEIRVYQTDGSEITNARVCKYIGNQLTECSSCELESGKDFYVKIPAGSQVSTIGKMTVKLELPVKAAKIWLLDSWDYKGHERYQNAVLVKPYSVTKTIYNQFYYDIEFRGNLRIKKVDADNHSILLNNVGFYIKNATENKYIKKSQTGDITFVNNKSEATSFITGRNGREGMIEINGLNIGKYIVEEDFNYNSGYDKNVKKEVEVKPGETLEYIVENKQKYVSISGTVWEDNIIEGKDSNYRNNLYKYGDEDIDDKELSEIIVRLIEKEQNTVIKTTKTNNKGIYTFINVNVEELENYYIEFEYDGLKYEDVSVDLQKDRGSKASETDSERTEFNEAYASIEPYDEASYGGFRVGDITIKDVNLGDVNLDGLIDEKDSTIVLESVANMRYLTPFQKVVADMDRDGEVTSNDSLEIQKIYGRMRQKEKLSSIYDFGITKNSNGIVSNILLYKKDEAAKTSTLVVSIAGTIKANTNNAKYELIKYFSYGKGQKRIENINLGLVEREQPNLSIAKDLKSVKVSVNGYSYVYDYAQRFKEYIDPEDNNLEIGVMYKDKYTGSYTRPIYESDYNYINSQNKSKELEIYLTYQIRMINESSNLNAKINEIIDYYDKNYTVNMVGTEINKEGKIERGEVTYNTPTTYNDKYNKLSIKPKNIRLNSGDQVDIYVEFKLNRESTVKIINNEQNLENIVEINSYSILDEELNVYAGVDKNSAPGNIIPGEIKTYEDDTDHAPDLKITPGGKREINGSVFLDYTDNTLKTGQERIGDGIFSDQDVGVGGVEVTLTENTGSGRVYKTTTVNNEKKYGYILKKEGNIYTYEPEVYRSNRKNKYAYVTENKIKKGDYLILGFIPGDYTITYTWGDKTYTVENYKGTIYKDKDRQTNKEWYKTAMPRYSDAIDNYELRIAIDTQDTTKYKDLTKMNSTTPTMGIGIEYNASNPSSIGTTYEYKISNVDFGIVERARQKIDMTKRATGIKITLANGQVLIDGQINKQGELEGNSIKGLIYIAPSNSSKNGLFRTEIDNEIIQGSTLEIKYEISVKNNSELDYDTENYYKYGIKGEEKDIIKIIPTVYDYLDNEMTIDKTKENATTGKWEVISKEAYNKTYEGETLVEEYYNERKSAQTKTKEDGTKYEWETGISKYQMLFEEWAETKVEARKTKLENKTILKSEKFGEKEILPGAEAETARIFATKVLSSNVDEIELNNDIEITEIRRNQKTGRKVKANESEMYDRAETVTITPPTGENQNYIIPIIIETIALIILGTGVIIIKKKVLKK